MKIHLPAPARDFGSDNRSGVSPSVLAALAAANIAARSESYGLDRESMGTTAAMCELFDQEVHAVLVPSGTAANVAAIGALLDGPGGCVLAAEDAHIRLDESGAIERAWGVPLVPVAVSAGLLPLDKISSSIARLRNNAPFSPKPMVLSLTELSETGRRYGAGLLAELCEIAHFYDIKVHVDGARFANALVEDPQLSSLFDLGVSTLAFGGTKNGQLPVEAIVSVDAQVHDRVYRAAKQLGYVQSKSRFVAAGLGESIRSGEFLANAAKANECAQRLSGLLTAGGLAPEYPVDGNLVFVRVPAHLIEGIDAWCHVSRWDESGLIRLACSWDHTFEDVDRLAAGLLLAFQSSESA